MAPPSELHPSTPWELRLFARLPLPAFWSGLVVGLGVFALFLGYSAVVGEVGRLPPAASEPMWGAELIQDLFLGWTLAVAATSLRGSFRDFDALRPALAGGAPEFERLRRELGAVSRPLLALLGLAGGLISLTLTIGDPGMWVEGSRPGWTHPAVLWLGGRNFLNWWVVLRAAALGLALGRAFARLGDHLAPVDLLDRTPLAPFTRRALRDVLLWMLLAAFLSLTYLGEGWALAPFPIGLGALAAFALATFTLPLLGARRSLREAKQRELARVRAVLRGAREAALDGEGASGRLADLLAWEARVEGAREWPIDAGTLLRFALYLALGLGSWVGAALVEWLLDRALG